MRTIRLIFILLISWTWLHAGSKTLYKSDQTHPPRRHPWSDLLSQNAKPQPLTQAKSPNYNKVLVLLIDFQEETTDDPASTGNGKFQLEPDPDYLYNIAAPPHNKEYYETNMEAMRHYYLAVSSGSYDLEYDVWPKTQAAYTLPHPMGYYNPPGATGEIFLARMEEYFQTAFTLADSIDPLINFADYGHYIIIHAGSDWQHDVNGDSPSDIPSFFIRVGEGKEVLVDGGTHRIYNACNVPATISQDFSQSGESTIYRSGYGALNSVLAHEFGHSLGLVDLYNVRSFQPMVGIFDIMDSGGSGILMDGPLDDGSFVLVEGILPALPGAFSRNLLFGEYFRSNGLMLDAATLSPDRTIQLAATSKKQTGNVNTPHTIRLDLNEREYVLLENRSVDPDGDGGTAVFSALDGRVVLYPTPAGDNTNTPSYEYDYLLPSFIKSDGSAVGGGILAWHVNNGIIFDQGFVDNDGNFISNYTNNTVNTSYLNRGVEVIEADGLPDLGNQYSWYWTGTQYEYFHKNKAKLNNSGQWLWWATDELWRPRLSADTEPAMLADNGAPSLYWLDEISNPAAVMTLKIKSGLFEHSQKLELASGHVFTTPVINSSFDVSDNLPLISETEFFLLSNRPVAQNIDWIDELGPFDYRSSKPDFPPVIANQYPDMFKELVLVNADTLSIIDFANDNFGLSKVLFDTPIACPPLALDNYLFVAPENSLYRIDNGVIRTGNTNVTNVKAMAAYGSGLVAISPQRLYILDIAGEIIEMINTGKLDFSTYEPVVYHNPDSGEELLVLTDSKGNIYRFENSGFKLIYSHIGTSLPTQLGIARTTLISPVLIFAAGNTAYAMQMDGTYLPGFPSTIFPQRVKPQGHVKALQTDLISFLFPLAESGYLALSETGVIQPLRSLMNWDSNMQDYMFWQESSSTLFWYYTGTGSSLEIKSLSGVSVNPLLWNGFRNGDRGVASFPQSEIFIPVEDRQIYIYPSPVNQNSFRLRLENCPDAGSYSIFNISGEPVIRGDIAPALYHKRDIIIDSSALSSGVYLISVKLGSVSRTVKFAVEK